MRINIQLSLLILIICLCSCSVSEKKTETTERDEFWERSTLSAENIDSLVIDSIHRDILAGAYGLIDHFLIIRNGKLVVDHHYEQDYRSVMEKYDTTNYQYNYDHIAWHPYYNNTDLHTLQSVTKSITSILLGIAVDKGLISSIDSSAMSYFSAYHPDLSDVRKKAMTIQDLLTMRSGIEWDEENYDDANNSCILMEESDDWIQFVLKQPMDTMPGTAFEYNSGASVLLGKIVREATGKRIDKWAEETLFKPLGISDYYWKVTPKGEIDTEGGLYLSPYDLAKIAYLMLHQGKWENQQIVSKNWVEASIHPTVDFDGESGYGYQWWIRNYQDDVVKIFQGNGYGGQFPIIVSEYDLIVVFNGWNIHDRPEKFTQRSLESRIIPGAQL